jgi:hypothetical protein
MVFIVPRSGYGSLSSGEESSWEEQWDWTQCTPEHGTDKYVQALQLLGLDMSKAIPKKVAEQAITALDVVPLSDLFIGKFARTPTKERLLNLSSFQACPLSNFV